MNKMTKLCEYCGKIHTRKRFCSNKCKDNWHNTTNPARRNRMESFTGMSNNKLDWIPHDEQGGMGNIVIDTGKEYD